MKKVFMNNPFRLNIEQQKKRAKELLKSFQQNDTEAIKRFNLHHPKLIFKELTSTEMVPKLADSQLVVARELCCKTWKDLKNHILLMDSFHDQIQDQQPIPDEPNSCLHIRCGSDIQQAVTKAGFKGEFIDFSDPLSVGPVSYDYNIEERAQFVFESYGKEIDLTYTDVLDKLSNAYEVVCSSARSHDHVALWFEHDPYDQLILIFLLSLYHRLGTPKNLWLVTTDKFPGSIRFRGMGQLPPEAIRLLWQTKQPVTSDQCHEANQHWKAFSHSSKEVFHDYIGSFTSTSFPYFKAASNRYLKEHPMSSSELPLTQEITINLLTKNSPQKAGLLFKQLTEKEDPLPFLGDIMYWHILKQMNDRGLVGFSNESERWVDTLIHLK